MHELAEGSNAVCQNSGTVDGTEYIDVKVTQKPGDGGWILYKVLRGFKATTTTQKCTRLHHILERVALSRMYALRGLADGISPVFTPLADRIIVPGRSGACGAVS